MLELKQGLRKLSAAIESYCYPCVAWDFQLGREIRFRSISEVEELFAEQLHSTDTERLKDGLSNVLFWGHYSRGGRGRVKKFRAGIDSDR